MSTFKVSDIVEFVQRTEALGARSELMLFRGQAKEGSLLPGIARMNPALDTSALEKKMLEQLQLQGASHLQSVGETLLDLMVVAQHFGLKTRLLDWTANPLAALWFACADTSEGDVYVYAIEADDFLEKDVYKRDPFETAKTRVFQARLNNDRIIAQDGWFTLHRYSKKVGCFVGLESNADMKGHIHRIRIEMTSRQPILKSLDKHGVNARTLFPDLAGLCKHLNNRNQLA